MPPSDPSGSQERAAPSHDIAYGAVLVLVLAGLRIAAALWRHEPPSRGLDIAWILVPLALLVLWKEFAARRRVG
jgi:hypothetical protein